MLLKKFQFKLEFNQLFPYLKLQNHILEEKLLDTLRKKELSFLLQVQVTLFFQLIQRLL